MGIVTGFTKSNGSGGTEDIGANLVEKSYLMDRYPELAGTLKQAGLWTWGFNNSGELGDNTGIQKSSPVQTIASGANWSQLSIGDQYIAAIKTNNTLWSWGLNQYGQLGTSNITNRSSPVQTVAAGTNWEQVSCGMQHTAAIKTDGTLWLWGRNVFGQLGTGNSTNRSSPVQTVSSGTNWKQVSTWWTTGAIKTDGTLWIWGYNANGQIGRNDIANRSSPVQTVAGGTNWKQCSMGFASAAIKTDGTLWTWGLNYSGQLGTNDTTHRSSPVQTISGGTNWKQVSSGGTEAGSFIAAIKTDGTLWLWGSNIYGQLCDGNNFNSTPVSSPVQTIAGGTNWKQVTAAQTFVTALKTDGTLWGWANNGSGQLGDNNSFVTYTSPVQTIAGGTNWKKIANTNNSFALSAAIRDDSSDPI